MVVVFDDAADLFEAGFGADDEAHVGLDQLDQLVLPEIASVKKQRRVLLSNADVLPEVAEFLERLHVVDISGKEAIADGHSRGGVDQHREIDLLTEAAFLVLADGRQADLPGV